VLPSDNEAGNSHPVAADIVKRRDEVIRHMLNTPPQPRVKPEVKEGESKKRGRPEQV